MRYKQFYPGNKVITIMNHDGVPSGSIGTVESRWVGNVYIFRMPDGSYRRLSDRELQNADKRKHGFDEGDIGVVTSDVRQHLLEVGDKLQVLKVIHDADYYEVLIGDEVYWLTGFELAPYIPPGTP